MDDGPGSRASNAPSSESLWTLKPNYESSVIWLHIMCSYSRSLSSHRESSHDLQCRCKHMIDTCSTHRLIDVYYSCATQFSLGASPSCLKILMLNIQMDRDPIHACQIRQIQHPKPHAFLYKFQVKHDIAMSARHSTYLCTILGFSIDCRIVWHTTINNDQPNPYQRPRH